MEHTKAYQEFKKNGNTKFVRYSEGAEMYHMSVSKFMQMAKDAKAIYKLGQLVLVNLKIFDEYIETFSHTFVNDRTTAKIHIYKVDKESGKAVAQGDASLEGAVYGLYARNDIVHPDGATGVVFKTGDLVATLTTDKNGEAEVNNLYLGNYYVKESKVNIFMSM